MNQIPRKIPAEFSERAGSAVYPEYSLDINAVISLSGRIDEQRMARAVRLLLDAEPILGCRFVERWFRPYWRRYDDLDSLAFFEVRNSSHPDSDVRRFLETPPNLLVWVLLLRSKSDVLCIKFDHRIVDGSAMAAAIYALGGIYNRLKHEPRYVPTPNVNASRSITQIAAGFTFREKWRFSRIFFDSVRRRKNLGQWQYPIPAAGDRELDYSIWQLKSDRLAAISKYALRQRASVNQVLLAAFHLAALGVLDHSADLPLPVRTTVDLRRYLRSRRPPGLCNLSGQSLAAIDSHAGTSLDAVVRQIRNQMHLQRKEYLGLIVSTFPYQGLPIRYLIDLIPYWYLKRMGRRAIETNRQRMESRADGDSFRGMLLLSNAGKLDANPFLFEGTEMTHAFGTTGIVKNPGVLGVVVSGFKDSLTLCLGVGPSSLINTISERMMQILPR